jgi:hypothetical protein
MLLQAWFLGMARRLPPERRLWRGLWRRLWAQSFGGLAALALLLGPTAGPLAVWVGLPVAADACLCPPERCRCPHDAPVAHRPALRDGTATAAADTDRDCASRASCPLRAAARAAVKLAGPTAAAGHRASRGHVGGAAAHGVAAGHGLHRASAGHSAHRTISTEQTVTPERLASRQHPTPPGHLASTGHLAVPQRLTDGGSERVASSAAVPPSPAGCSIASRCGGDAPAGTGTMTWLQAAGGAGAGWAAPLDAGDPAPPAAAARLLDTLRSPDPPPPRRTAPIA